ncbi:hypothetical protein BH11CYA1_BH11CYA1_01380 [soil metagenome]
MPIQLDKFDDDHLFSDSSQRQRPQYVDDKLAREIYVVTRGTIDAVAAIKERVPEVAVEVAASLVTGFAIRAAEAKLPWLRPGIAIGGLALSASVLKDLVKPASEIASTLSDTWSTADGLEANRSRFAATGGKFVVDLALTTSAGLTGSALANRALFGVGSNYLRINTYEQPSQTFLGGPRARLYNRQEPDAATFIGARESSVRVTANRISGGRHTHSANGFLASEDGLIVTNHHVVAGKIDINTIDASGTVRKAKVVAMSGADDLAVLKIESDKSFKAVKISQEAAQPGDRVLPISHQFDVRGLTIGPGTIENIELMPIRVRTDGHKVRVTDPSSYNPADHSFKFSRELAADTNEIMSERFFGNYYSKSGASGSPLFNEKGEVVAALAGGWNGNNYAIPAKTITEILDLARRNLASK